MKSPPNKSKSPPPRANGQVAQKDSRQGKVALYEDEIYGEKEAFRAGTWIRKNAQSLLDPGPRAIALFGSFIRGDTRPESDLDLLLVGDSIPQRPAERTRWVYPLIQAFHKEMANGKLPSSIPRSLSPLMISERGWCESTGLRLSLAEECWILLDDGFLSSTLLEAAGWLRNGLWNRQATRDGGWLWIPSSVEGSV